MPIVSLYDIDRLDVNLSMRVGIILLGNLKPFCIALTILWRLPNPRGMFQTQRCPKTEEKKAGKRNVSRSRRLKHEHNGGENWHFLSSAVAHHRNKYILLQHSGSSFLTHHTVSDAAISDIIMVAVVPANW